MGLAYPIARAPRGLSGILRKQYLIIGLIGMMSLGLAQRLLALFKRNLHPDIH